MMCTLEKRGHIFILTLTGDDEHRLNLAAIDVIKSKLAAVKSEATKGSVLITKAEGRFFSNGFDLAWAQAAGSKSGATERLLHMVDYFKPIVSELLSFPMPTIAAVTGHAAAAGFMLALCHDYVYMRSDKGVMYMSELDIGITLPDYFTALIRAKIGSPATIRAVLLKSMKIRADEAVKMGIIDAAYDSPEKTVEASLHLAEELGKKKWDGEVYAEIRKSLYPEVCGSLGLVDKVVARL